MVHAVIVFIGMFRCPRRPYFLCPTPRGGPTCSVARPGASHCDFCSPDLTAG